MQDVFLLVFMIVIKAIFDHNFVGPLRILTGKDHLERKLKYTRKV